MKLSIIVPSIRPQNLLSLYNSIDVKDFEMIVIGPFVPMWWTDKLKFIESFRSPNCSQQQGLMEATGEYVSFASDDGVFLPGMLEHAFVNLLCSDNSDLIDYKTIVVSKYLEGDNPNPDMLKEDYYKFKYHKAYKIWGVPQENYIFNCGIISRKFIIELGGWDCENFECTTMAHADLGIRAQKAGAKMILMDEPMFKCSHEPKRTGTHGPIHDSMNKHDIPNFRKKYERHSCLYKLQVPLDNWKNTPEVWKRRFKK